MSAEHIGNIDYAKIKRNYPCNDYPSLFAAGVNVLNGIPFTQNETYYTSGICAFLNDANVVDVDRGWTTFTHGQPAVPVYLAALLAAAGVVWPAAVPAFEAKHTLFYATEECWVRFDGSSRVRHFIPADQYMWFFQRWFMIFVIRAGQADGTLRAWIEG